MAKNISVIGLGKLGSPLAAVLASKGHRVIGHDLHKPFVESLNAGVAPVGEPLLQSTIDAAGDRLSATSDCAAAVLGTDATFIIVPTPSDEQGAFTNRYVVEAVEAIGAALRRKTTYHLVVVTSTVMPGSTGGVIRDALERSSGRTVGDALGLCYNPEFIALGSVIRDMLHPDMLLIGESDTKAGDVLEEIGRSMCESTPAVERMNFVNAELTKISVNTYITAKISYANMIADLCDRLPEADVDVVTQALGRDTRIGSKYLKGALGYGGPCLPRDNVALARLAQRVGARADLAEATDRINDHQIKRLAGIVRKRLRPGDTVGVLGLSYKPDTSVIEESQGVELAHLLATEGYRVLVHDPMALEPAMVALHGLVEAAGEAADCLAEARLVVITTPWPEYRALPPAALERRTEALCIVDCWRVLPETPYESLAEIVRPGRWMPEGEWTLAAAAAH